jgi:hypothetical protein
MNVFEEEKEPECLSRCGYKPGESLRAFEHALSESGAIATGKAFHFSADILCSGGYVSWVRCIWNFVIQSVGIASPRIFIYLLKRFQDLDQLSDKYPDETLWNNDAYQKQVAELIMVVREAPRRSKITWPKVGSETHGSQTGWLKAVATATEPAVVRRVWKVDGDLPTLRIVGSELTKAIGEGATQKCLFWIRWLLEEEVLLRKETKGSLTTVNRSFGKGKGKHDVGNFVVALYIEIYNEYAEKGMIRMNEEFQGLLQLWGGDDARVTGSQRKQILGIMTQILCEVPRWKIPAAPPLIRDPIFVSRAVGQVPKFFHEVLAYPSLRNEKEVQKQFSTRGVVQKKKKIVNHETQFDAVNKALDDYMSSRL